MKKIEHIGIAVKDIKKASALFDVLFDKPAYKTEEVASENVLTRFYEMGESKIELLAATDESSSIEKYISKRGEGMHHIAFAVDDIHAEMDRLAAKGFVLLNDKPKKGADNKLICFIHPKSAGGVLVELCQEAT